MWRGLWGMKKEILNEVKKIEKKENIKVLFLIESGSRAWGWESADSDYDIRGVYIQDYLKLEEPKDNIELIKGDYDIVLWGLKKFLRLLKKSNPSTWEWLSSDLIYIDNEIKKELIKIFNKGFSEESLKYHYLSMARQNFKKYIQGKRKANLKKYTYVLRSIACVLWIEKYKKAPPKNYKKVIKVLPNYVQDFFNEIVKAKRSSEDLKGKRNSKVDKFITKYFNKKFDKTKDRFDKDEINKIFIREARRFLK